MKEKKALKKQLTWAMFSMLFLLNNYCFSQAYLTPSDSLRKDRLLLIALGEGAFTASSLAGLHFAWYQQYDKQPFTFFNDWDGWLQMDKTGHAVSAYQAASLINDVHKWTGLNGRESRWMSSGLTVGYLTAVEIMDGYSAGWGFSWGDFAFNLAGAGLFHAQDALWSKQIAKLKFSFSPSGLTSNNRLYNERELKRAKALYGTAFYEQWLKDYNGQTHWLSLNIWSLTGKPSWMPKWIDFSLGYSANGMLGATSNTWSLASEGLDMIYHSQVQRERQFLLSLDLNLDHVDLPKGLVWLKPIAHLVKFPFPTLELNNQTGIHFRPFYF